jgi:hypothetical protein
MAGKEKLSTQQVIEAIKGTGGIVSVIARKLAVDWETIRAMIDRHPSVKAAFEAERESVLDLSESVLMQNIRLAQRAQLPQRDDAGNEVYPLPVDTSDAKWMLSKRGKHRGYGERVEVTGADGGPVQLQIVERIIDANAPSND